MMYIDPIEKAIALNLDAIGAFLRTVKGDSVPAVMFVLFSKCQPNNHSYIRLGEIARHTGFSMHTVSKAVKKLISANIVAKCEDGDFLINPDVAFIGEQSTEKRHEFSVLSKRLVA
jgi:DNA-binding IclR family transcriptional regulator